jgi:hypothetical protein
LDLPCPAVRKSKGRCDDAVGMSRSAGAKFRIEMSMVLDSRL